MNDFEKLKTLLEKQEQLHPDLAEYQEVVNGIPMIRHPLVFSLFHAPPMNAMVNAQYAQKVAGLKAALSDSNWTTYLYLHERPYRLQAFLEIYEDMTPTDYWEFLSSIWVDSENIHQNQEEWIALLSRTGTERIHFMDEDEREQLAALPDQIKIYRGHDGRNPNGLSWTLDRAKAAWFSRRLSQGKPRVAERTIPRGHALALKTGRGEQEIVLDPLYMP